MRKALVHAGILFILMGVGPRAMGAEKHEAATEHEAKAAQGGEHGNSAEPGGPHAEKTYFGIPGWILKTINVAVFLGLLGWLLKGPLATAFTERRVGIRRGLNQAAERRQKADNMAVDIEARLTQIEREVETILERAREEGEKQKNEIILTAEQESEKILATAKSQIDQRLRQARRELTEYAGVLATQKARTLVESNLTEEDRRNLFDESVRKLREAGS